VEGSTTDKPPKIAGALAAKHGTAEDVFDHFGEDADLIVGVVNSEPATVLDALEERGEQLCGVAAHQMLPLRKRRYMPRKLISIAHPRFREELKRQAREMGYA
jgi:hypothetical protein